MGSIETNLTKASYMMKRLRDSGYRADKLLGVSDPKSLAQGLDKLTQKLFPEGRSFQQPEILDVLKNFQKQLIRFMYCPPNYGQQDSRVWTILIDGGRDNVFLTFYRNSKGLSEKYEEHGQDFFEIYDGGQYVRPIRKRIKTFSFEVISQELNAMGIVKKFSQK